jgi:hypothetical protein
MSSVSAVLYWDVQLLDNRSYPDADRIFTNKFDFTFTPTVTGIYKISMTNAMKDGRTITLDIIPPLSVLPTTFTEQVPIEITTPRSSFIIEHNLTGWSYNRRRRFPSRPGAKPYWATLYTGKESANKFKGAFSWGYNNTFADGYLPLNTPAPSPIEIFYQNIISYKRKGEAFNWKQPINFKEGLYLAQWCKLTNTVSNSSNIAEFFATKDKPELVAIASKEPSDIILSNDVDGKTPEIEYYALNPFTWSISANIEIPLDYDVTDNILFKAKEPQQNLTNRFFPSIANVPTLEKTFTESKVGGYFIPQHLGISILVNKDFVPIQKDTVQELKEDVNVHIGGLGLSKQKQQTNYNWFENNEWVMEPSVAGELAGSPKKKLTKSLQTFVPYQANSDENPLGLITTRSRYSPWGGALKEDWTDKLNEPKSFTGVRNVSAWLDSQILKQSDTPLDCWANDVYGNQYGLFKDFEGLTTYERRELTGELWVRTNEQKVLKSSQALSSIFSPYENTNVYSDLTGSGIKYVDCFFDTLMVETTGAIIFAEVIYDYENGIIDSTYDNTRSLFLTANSFRYENSWFFTSEKRIVNLVTTLTANAFVPQLWEIEIDTRRTTFTFPTSAEKQTIISSLSSLSAQSISRGLITYNDVNRNYLVTYNGVNVANKPFVVNFYIKNTGNKNVLEEIEIYKDTTDTLLVTEPPAVLAQYLSAIPVSANVAFSINVSALNNPTYYTLVNYTSSVIVTNTGTFSGTLTATGIHHVNYAIGNEIGETYYSLTLVAS